MITTNGETHSSTAYRRSFVAQWLGRLDYGSAHELQSAMQQDRIAGRVGDTLLLVEHDPVITLGRSAHERHVLLSAEELVGRGIEVHQTGRGGDVTYHGPGQLVAYPIFDLRPDRCDVRRYVRDLARVMIDLCEQCGVAASFLEGDSKLVGVWVDETSPARWRGDPRRGGSAGRLAKIGAIGVRISRWVTMHGFALNLSVDPSAFAPIVPCGISSYGVTSLAALGATVPTTEDAARMAVRSFERVFQARGQWIDRL